jgi:hypothetical protein
MHRRFASIDLLLVSATVDACLVAASGLDGGATTLALLAGLCYGVMCAITLPRTYGSTRVCFAGTSSAATRPNGTGCPDRATGLHRVRIVLGRSRR